ncbi:MAG: AroM family protein [Bilophila wadsworthia]
MECLGFKEELRKPIADIVKKPVLLVRTVVASTIKEIASSF